MYFGICVFEGCGRLILDVGCGWIEGRHKRVKGSVGVDIMRGLGDVVGDGCHLPFRDGVFDRVCCNAVLEHISNPLSCVKEMLRVGKRDCVFEFVLPINCNIMRVFLRKLVLEFPFSVISVFRDILVRRKMCKIKGMNHISNVTVGWLSKYFWLDSIEVVESHFLSRGNRGLVLGKFTRGRTVFSGYELRIVGRSWSYMSYLMDLCRVFYDGIRIEGCMM